MKKRNIYILLMIVALLMLGCSNEDEEKENNNNSSQQEQVSVNDENEVTDNKNAENDGEKTDGKEEQKPAGNTDTDNKENDKNGDKISDKKEDDKDNSTGNDKGEIGKNDSENNGQSENDVNIGKEETNKGEDGVVIPEDNTDKEIVDVEISVTDDGEVIIEEGEKGSKESIVAGLDYPKEFDKKDLADADIVFVKIDENETPDIIVSSGEDTSMIWIYDEEKEEYVYSHEMSKVTQEGKVELEGSWMSEGVQLDIVKNDDLYSVIISKNIEGVEMTEWIYECKMSKSDILECSKKGCKTVVKFEEGGTVSSIEEQYSDGSAKFYIKDGKLCWKDEKEDNSKIIMFERFN